MCHKHSCTKKSNSFDHRANLQNLSKSEPKPVDFMLKIRSFLKSFKWGQEDFQNPGSSVPGITTDR
jgi:hypothetical protein